ncbi:MFS transporter [Cumulibacter soli]|uniref:MFS transporter n=1 Tax=Cumulibacter soli TaxID=2546344 RepID=UPI0010673B82|nr:MFS transporter [Cumulibacter soli]
MPSESAAPSARRWLILAIGVLAQTSACAFVYGIPLLVPVLRDSLHLDLATAGVYVALPTFGLLLTLIAWGAAADRYGERIVMSSGMAITAVAVAAAAWIDTPGGALMTLLVVGGAGAGCVFAASGRMIMGWFPRTERGLAMGIRQTAQPLGVALAGFALPSLALAHGVFASLLLPAALCLLSAVLVATCAPDPPRPPRSQMVGTPSPYRTPHLWRIHATSALLVVPQFAIGAFAAEYLVREQGWSATSAGAFVATVQIAGAASRIGAGWWSDRVGSRLRPTRQLAISVTIVMLVFALGDALAAPLAIAMLVVGGILSVADNGLAFTAVAEVAGVAWSGRAMGIQNTGQNLLSSGTPIALGALIGSTGYAAGFAIAALAPFAAIFVVPVRDEGPPTW